MKVKIMLQAQQILVWHHVDRESLRIVEVTEEASETLTAHFINEKGKKVEIWFHSANPLIIEEE